MTGHFGFIFYVDLYEASEVDDGYGGITKKLNLTQPEVLCRISALSNDEQREKYGDVVEHRFILILKGEVTITTDTYVSMSEISAKSPLEQNETYKVIQPGRKRFLHTPVVHHTVAHIELHDNHELYD